MKLNIVYLLLIIIYCSPINAQVTPTKVPRIPSKIDLEKLKPLDPRRVATHKTNTRVGDELLSLSGQASKETQEIQNIVNELFKNIELAIEETNEIANDLIVTENRGDKLSKETKSKIKSRIEKIYTVYSNINYDESYYKKLLRQSSLDARRIVNQTSQILAREEQEYNNVVLQINRLGKVDSASEEYDELRALNTKQNLRKIIVETLAEFNSEMGNFNSKHSDSKDRIDRFFKQVGYSKDVTALMIEVLDLSIKVEMVKENVQALQEIDKYTTQMYESLESLSNSLNSLKEIAREYQ